MTHSALAAPQEPCNRLALLHAVSQAALNSRVLAIDLPEAGRSTIYAEEIFRSAWLRTKSAGGSITRYFRVHPDTPAIPSSICWHGGLQLRDTTFAEVANADIEQDGRNLTDVPLLYLFDHAELMIGRKRDLRYSDIPLLYPRGVNKLMDELWTARQFERFPDGVDEDAPLPEFPEDDLDRAADAFDRFYKQTMDALRFASQAATDTHTESIAVTQASQHVTSPAEAHLRSSLPDFAPALLDLPHALGEIQRWINGRMKYPSLAAAGVTAMALITHFAMPHITVSSYDGLGLNEQYLVLAPTGFGKEDLRKPFDVIEREIRGMEPPPGQPLWLGNLPQIQYSAPASQQGLHALLEANRAQTFLSDEFGEWLCQVESDSHKQAALGHFMQAYTRATGTLAAPASVTRAYKQIERPRVLVFATSTAERILETFNASQAERGALNRFVIFPAEQQRIEKKYRGLVYEPPQAVVDAIAWIFQQPECEVTLSTKALEFFEEHDSKVIEPMRFESNVLAGRLSEQAIKMAAVIALSDRRLEISQADLAVAYAIRQNIHERAAVLVGDSGAISGMHVTGIAVEQLTKALRKHRSIAVAHLSNHSRKFKGLDSRSRESVIKAVLLSGVARMTTDRGNRLVAVDTVDGQ